MSENQYQVGREPQGSSGPIFLGKNASLDKMAQHPVQLNLKYTMLGNPPVSWGVSNNVFSHFEKLPFCV